MSLTWTREFRIFAAIYQHSNMLEMNINSLHALDNYVIISDNNEQSKLCFELGDIKYTFTYVH